jgi:hypothetical protein
MNSIHLAKAPQRREDFRRCRQAALDARGWLTAAGECAHGLLGEGDDWPSLLPVRPDQVIAGTRWFLLHPGKGGAYPLKVGLNTVGRLRDNDIVLGGDLVSRRHCVLLVHVWGGCDLHDTASLNGTWVNGRRIHQSVRLSSGDQIEVGETSLVFLNESDVEGEPDKSEGDHDTVAR